MALPYFLYMMGNPEDIGSPRTLLKVIVMSILFLVAAGIAPGSEPARFALLACGFLSVAAMLRRGRRVPLPVKVQTALPERLHPPAVTLF